MSFVTRVLFLLTSLICLSGALALLVTGGLPDRASYTGVLTDRGLVAPDLFALAPSFTATDVDGSAIRLEDYRGSTTILNFWATWCGPCAAEMPELQALYEAQQRNGVRVIGINLGEDVVAVARWAEAYGLTFDLALDPDGTIAAAYQLRGQPSTYIISPEGIITSIFYGPTTFAQLEAALPPSF